MRFLRRTVLATRLPQGLQDLICFWIICFFLCTVSRRIWTTCGLRFVLPPLRLRHVVHARAHVARCFFTGTCLDAIYSWYFHHLLVTLKLVSFVGNLVIKSVIQSYTSAAPHFASRKSSAECFSWPTFFDVVTTSNPCGSLVQFAR